MNLKYLLLFFIVLFSGVLFADKPVCHETHGGYCVYEGTVKRIYINDTGRVLMYFDTQMDEGEWDKAGYSITNSNAKNAATILINDNPEFAKLFYSTALAAQSTKRRVTIQMRGVSAGYLKIDRIWLSE